MSKKRTSRPLGGRERQIMDVIYRLGEASVADVRNSLADAPSYSAVRTMMGILEQKGQLKRQRDGVRHIYRPARPRSVESRSALKHLIATFFGGSAGAALAALVDHSATDLSDEDLDRLQAAIDRARSEEHDHDGES